MPNQFEMMSRLFDLKTDTWEVSPKSIRKIRNMIFHGNIVPNKLWGEMEAINREFPKIISQVILYLIGINRPSSFDENYEKIVQQ